MKPVRRLPDLVRDMMEAAQRALQYTAGMDKAGFLMDTRTQQAVCFNFVILGEAATRVLDSHAVFAAGHTRVPWRAIRNMRNQVAHGYAAIDMDLVWGTVTRYLPALVAELPAIISAAKQLQAADDGPPTPAE